MLTPLEDIPNLIETLARDPRAGGETWTLAQIADHLARTIEWQLGMSPPGGLPARLPPMWLRRVYRAIFLRAGRLPRNVPTIESLVPPPNVMPADAIARLRRSIKLLGAASEPFPAHPFFGVMTKARWIRFHEVHAAHHLRSAKEAGKVQHGA